MNFTGKLTIFKNLTKDGKVYFGARLSSTNKEGKLIGYPIYVSFPNALTSDNQFQKFLADKSVFVADIEQSWFKVFESKNNPEETKLELFINKAHFTKLEPKTPVEEKVEEVVDAF